MISMESFSVILAAAGKSSRFGSKEDKKPFIELCHHPVWWHSAALFRQRTDVRQMILLIAEEDRQVFFDRFRDRIKRLKIEVVMGGEERADSIENGLAAVDECCEWVAIHDAARPCIDAETIERVFQAAIKFQAAVPVIPISSTVKKSTDGQTIESTVDREGLYLAQTPQVFRRELIQNLFRSRAGRNVTDEAQLAEQLGVSVSIVKGSIWNQKITTADDFLLTELYLRDRLKKGKQTP